MKEAGGEGGHEEEGSDGNIGNSINDNNNSNNSSGHKHGHSRSISYGRDEKGIFEYLRPSLEVLACVGNITKAMGHAVESHVRCLLDVMFSAGLSPTLIEALEQITARPAAALVRGTAANIPQPMFELSGSALVQLALQTLARFNFRLMEKLLIVAVADADVTVRHSIFSSLHGNRGFDDFLAQADSLGTVFAALNDEEKDLKIMKEAKIREEMLDLKASLRRARAEASLVDGIS
ncbi:hypothetical protein POUND7_003734 [Theobroma cacao]